MQSVKVCRGCLITDVKMYSMDDSFISNAYLELTGLIKYSPPHFLCYECSALLKKCEEFRCKCMRAHTILRNLSKQHSKITHDVLNNLDRKGTKLESSLSNSPMQTYKIELTLENSGHSTNDEENILIDVIKNEEIKQNDYSDTDDKKYLFDTKTGSNDTNNTVLKKISELILSHCNNINSDDFSGAEDISSVYDVKEQYQQKRNRDLVGDKTKNSKNKKTKSQINKKKLKDKCNDDLVDNIIVSNDTEKSDSTKFKNLDKKKSRPKFDESYFEEFATVVLLTPEEARKEVLLRKESNNYINCQFKCDFCYRGFEAQGTYENHMKKHSTEYGNYECDYCHLRFPEQRFLCKHRLSSHKRKFYCKICPYTCFCTDQAKIHVSLHKGKKYPCKDCNEIFSMPNSLLMHKRIKHPTKCVCDMCGSTFATERGLRSHKMLLHRQESNTQRGPSCQECGVHFANDIAWKRHLVLSSRHNVSHGCESCGETFENAKALKAHSRTHARKQPTRGEPKLPGACTMCSEWLRDRTERRDHLLTVHPNTEAARRVDVNDTPQCVCEICGKMFKKRCFLIYHQRAHTGERPYRCTDCGKAYAFPGALSVHRGTHSTAARHHCHLCAKHFTFRSALNKHLKAHMGIRPHKCGVCGKSFPSPCDVRLHTQYVHHKVPWPKRERTRRQPSHITDHNATYNYSN